MDVIGQLLSKIMEVVGELIDALMPIVEALLEVINEVIDIVVDLIFRVLDPIIELLNLLTDTGLLGQCSHCAASLPHARSDIWRRRSSPTMRHRCSR